MAVHNVLLSPPSVKPIVVGAQLGQRDLRAAQTNIQLPSTITFLPIIDN